MASKLAMMNDHVLAALRIADELGLTTLGIRLDHARVELDELTARLGDLDQAHPPMRYLRQ